MRRAQFSLLLAAIVLLWATLLKTPRSGAKAESPVPKAKANIVSDPGEETWRRVGHTLPRPARSLHPEEPLPETDTSSRKAKQPLKPWISRDRAEKLYELVGFETWPALVAPEGLQYSREEVLRIYPFLAAEDGSVDETLVAGVRSALDDVAEARKLDGQNPSGSQFAKANHTHDALDNLYKLLRPVLGWTPERRGRNAEPTEEMLAIVPQPDRLQGVRLAHVVKVIAMVQTAAEQRPEQDRYVGDIQKILEGSERISLTEEQARALLNTPIERLVRKRVPKG